MALWNWWKPDTGEEFTTGYGWTAPEGWQQAPPRMSPRVGPSPGFGYRPGPGMTTQPKGYMPEGFVRPPTVDAEGNPMRYAQQVWPAARPSPQAPTSFVPSDTLSKSGPGFGGGSDFGYTTPYTMPYTMPSVQFQGYEPLQPVAALETPSTIKPPQSQKPVTAERQQAGPAAPEGSLTALGWPSTSQLIASVKAGRVSLQQAIQKLVYLKSVSQDAPTIAKVTAAIEVLRREFRSKPK